MRRAILLSSALLLALFGCDKVRGGPLSLEWASEHKFEVKGSSEQYGEVAEFEGSFQVTLHGFPEGTKWKCGDKSGKVESDIYDICKLGEATSKLGSVSISKLSDATLDPGCTFSIETPAGGKGKVKLKPVRVGLSVEEALKKVENGPVTFGDEPKDEKPGQNVMLLQGLTPKVFGPAQTLQDLDMIALVRQLAAVKGTKKCTGYKDRSDKPMPDLDLQLKETEVTIYERRTGKQVERKIFPPDEECPMLTFQAKGDSKTDSSPPTQQIEDWLRQQIKP